MNEPGLRRGIRIAASILLIAAGMHAVLHYHSYWQTSAFDERREAIMHAMQAYVVAPQFGTTLWTVLNMFSVAFAILLMLAGTAYWWLAKDMPATRLRPLATASAWLCLLGALLIAAVAPVAWGVTILFGAGCAFAWASWSGRPGRPLP